jgi:mannose-6-phosphate isomerase-like protein (cupin superfamily)
MTLLRRSGLTKPWGLLERRPAITVAGFDPLAGTASRRDCDAWSGHRRLSAAAHYDVSASQADGTLVVRACTGKDGPMIKIVSGALMMALAALGLGQDAPSKRDELRTEVFEVSTIAAERRAAGRAYQQFLKVPSMSAGLYELPAGGVDGQRPHAEDEIYYVRSGKAVFRSEGKDTPVGPGAIIYVRRGVDHRFVDITEDLSVLVVFAAAVDGG